MDVKALIKEVGRGAKGARDLPEPDAERLYAAMLAGEIPELQLGALLMAYRIKGESAGELSGFLRAAQTHVAPIAAPTGPVRPIVFASYNGARKQANLLPLMALLLARHGVPVLIHGVATDPGRVTSAEILAQLGVPAATGTTQAGAQLATNRIAFIALDLLAPALARLLATRARLGVRSSAHTVAKLIDPCGGQAVRVVAVTHPDYLARMRGFLVASHADALLMRGTEGEPYASPRRQPAIEHFHAGEVRTLVEPYSLGAPDEAPETISAQSTATWTRAALRREVAIAPPLVNQLACCLYAAGAAPSFVAALAQLGRSVRLEAGAPSPAASAAG
jgi:anthranilate phosphoribosyltransferase